MSPWTFADTTLDPVPLATPGLNIYGQEMLATPVWYQPMSPCVVSPNVTLCGISQCHPGHLLIPHWPSLEEAQVQG